MENEENNNDAEQPSSYEPRAALEIEDGNPSDEEYDEEEQVSLMLGRSLRRKRRRGTSYDDDEEVQYYQQQRSPYLPIYLGGATVLVLLLAAVFIPSSQKDNKNINHKCESVYTDNTSWNSFLQRIDQQDPADRCYPHHRSSSSKTSSSSSSVCKCHNPLEPYAPTEPPQWKHMWQNAFQSNLDLVAKETRRNLDVVMLGDSITEQWHGTSLGQPVPKYSAKAKVYQRLFVHNTTSSSSSDASQQVQGLALGISGDRCPQLLYRITNGELDNLQQEPHVWWILIGTNDYLQEACSVDSIVAGNIRIVQQLLSRQSHVKSSSSVSSKVVINSLLPVGNAKGIRHEQDYLDVNRRLECFANSHHDEQQRVFFFNATSIFLTPQNTVNETLLPDGLHPSAEASELWGQAIVDKVLEIEKRRPG